MKQSSALAASLMTNMAGQTPLHIAVAQPGVKDSISTVLALSSPEAANVMDRIKRYPIHVACQNKYASPALIRSLIKLNVRALSLRAHRGHLPLHLATQFQLQEAAITVLLKAYPRAINSKNKVGNISLHNAVRYGAPYGIVKSLLDAFPDIVYMQNQFGNTALHCAAAYRASRKVMKLLLEVSHL